MHTIPQQRLSMVSGGYCPNDFASWDDYEPEDGVAVQSLTRNVYQFIDHHVETPWLQSTLKTATFTAVVAAATLAILASMPDSDSEYYC